MIARRTFPSNYIRDLDHLVTLNYPMFDVFIPEMIRTGVYQVKDEVTGKILSPQEAMRLLDRDEE